MSVLQGGECLLCGVLGYFQAMTVYVMKADYIKGISAIKSGRNN